MANLRLRSVAVTVSFRSVDQYHATKPRGIGFQPIVFGTVFALSSNARLAACLPAEFASRIWHVAKPVMLDVLVHYENGSQ